MKPKFAIGLATRNNLDYLKLMLKSAWFFKSNKLDLEFFIYLDGCTDGTKDYLTKLKNSTWFKFPIHIEENNTDERMGITRATNRVMKMIDKSGIDKFYLVHSDMIFGPNWDWEIYKLIKSKRLVCATRVEPPIFPAESCKVHYKKWTFPKDFKWYDWITWLVLHTRLKRKYNHLPTKGCFAPYAGLTKEWMKYGVDENLAKQSNEECSLFYEMLQDGFTFLQSWKTFVFHFGGRGNRFAKNNVQTYTEEWIKTNKKSVKNFIRKWGQDPIMDEWSFPILINPQPKKKLSFVSLISTTENLYNFIEYNEPWFDELILVVDSSKVKVKEVKEIVKEYIENNKDHYYFDPKKIKVFSRKLNKNFAAQRNFGQSKAKYSFIFHLDQDEMIPIEMLRILRQLANANKKIKVIGFARKNIVDGKDTGVFPDYQFRFVHKSVKFVNKVHEVPEQIKKKNTKTVAVMPQNLFVFHVKTKETYNKQQEFYDKIKKGAGGTRL